MSKPHLDRPLAHVGSFDGTSWSSASKILTHHSLSQSLLPPGIVIIIVNDSDIIVIVIIVVIIIVLQEIPFLSVSPLSPEEP